MQQRTALVLVSALFALLVGGCGSSLDALRGSPSPTPTDFTGLVRQMATHEITVDNVVSGDAGCSDHALVPMAISFTASGAGESAPVAMRVYRFKNGESYDRLRASVDACAAAWIRDPGSLTMIDASPFVLVFEGVSEGPFIDALRTTLHEAAGD